MSEMCRELLNTNRKTANTPLKKRAKDLKRHLTKEDAQMTNKHRKRCPTWYGIREVQ